ncbi:hypothetical protein SCHPADRAFT_684318 [Schizopora paradoxa]|uniref:Uncharacterized protein n=1 Tax=Schizopora paradoxa TaxID=27342 RepID=A0A0H2RAR8_9AGAM|nr:hypothetical protein SCHPADRAFT_684318 [Schizopora paradoxa]
MLFVSSSKRQRCACSEDSSRFLLGRPSRPRAVVCERRVPERKVQAASQSFRCGTIVLTFCTLLESCTIADERGAGKGFAELTVRLCFCRRTAIRDFRFVEFTIFAIPIFCI